MKITEQILQIATPEWLTGQLAKVDPKITLACEQVSQHTGLSKTVIFEHAKGTRRSRSTTCALYHYFKLREQRK